MENHVLWKKVNAPDLSDNDFKGKMYSFFKWQFCDEEFFYIALFFNKNNTNPDILWSIDRNSLPEDLKFVMEYYEKIRGSL